MNTSTLYLVHIHVQERIYASATNLNTSAGFPKFPRMSSGAMYFASPSIASLDFSSRETHRPKSPSLQVTPSPPMKMLAGLMSKWHNRLSWRCFRPCGREYKRMPDLCHGLNIIAAIIYSLKFTHHRWFTMDTTYWSRTAPQSIRVSCKNREESRAEPVASPSNSMYSLQ